MAYKTFPLSYEMNEALGNKSPFAYIIKLKAL